MQHGPRTVALFGALVVLALGVTASAANAYTPIPFEWKVKGTSLKEGASKELTLRTKGAFHFTLIHYAVKLELTSSKVKLVEGKITGGKPGKISGKLVFEGVTVTRPKENCVVQVGNYGQHGVIETGPLTGEIVEVVRAEEKARVGVDLTTTNYWPEIYIEAAKGGGHEECSWDGNGFLVTGGLVAEVSPQEKEAAVEDLSIPGGEGGRNIKGEFTKSLESHPGTVKVSGEMEAELVSKELFGAF